MSKLYLIQYDINNSIAFEDKIKTIGSCIRIFETSWIVETQIQKSRQIFEYLTTEENPDGNIFIIEIDKSNYWGWMDKSVWGYLKTKEEKK